MLGDGSTWWTSTTSPSLAPLGLTVNQVTHVHRNPWLEPNEWKHIALARLSNEMFGYFRFFLSSATQISAKIISGV